MFSNILNWLVKNKNKVIGSILILINGFLSFYLCKPISIGLREVLAKVGIVYGHNVGLIIRYFIALLLMYFSTLFVINKFFNIEDTKEVEEV